MAGISEKTIGRLSLYRRILTALDVEGVFSVCSHDLAQMTRSTSAQVRRDLMLAVGCQGTRSRGYNVVELLSSISAVLDDPEGQGAALVGVGNLGRALVAYLAGRRPKLSLLAAFDADPRKVDRTINGCPCFPVDAMARVIAEKSIAVGIIAVPASAAQDVADALVAARVRALLNFAPVRLRIAGDVFIENIDITMSLEKAAYFARQAVAGAVGGGTLKQGAS